MGQATKKHRKAEIWSVYRIYCLRETSSSIYSVKISTKWWPAVFLPVSTRREATKIEKATRIYNYRVPTLKSSLQESLTPDNSKSTYLLTCLQEILRKESTRKKKKSKKNNTKSWEKKKKSPAVAEKTKRRRRKGKKKKKSLSEPSTSTSQKWRDGRQPWFPQVAEDWPQQQPAEYPAISISGEYI